MKSSPTIHYSAEERKALISQWRTSGKTKKEFCDYRGIKIQTFYSWFKPERIKAIEKPASEAFVPIEVKSSLTPEVFAELSTPSGARISFFQPVSSDYLKKLI
jgi:hypothetical protein